MLFPSISPLDPSATLATPNIFRRIGPGCLPDIELRQLHCHILNVGAAMRRREFVTLLGGAAAAWPLAATRAQQGARMPRIGVLFTGGAGKDTAGKYIETFTKSLLELGWVDGKNIKIDYRFADYDVAQAQVLARELINLKPDVILAINTLVVAAFQHETKSIPIVFVAVTDPVASGFVASLSHPGGNITGFSNFDPTLIAKHIEILKQISPGMTTVLVPTI